MIKMKWMLVFISVLILLTPILSQENNPWSFRFGFGTLFPDASEIVNADDPYGLNLSAAMVYKYNSRVVIHMDVYFDYFTDEKRTDYRTHVFIVSPTFECHLHPFPWSYRVSPYLIGAVAPALYINSQPYIPEGEPLDPYTTQRDYDIRVGYSLKYGLGTSVKVGDSIYLWVEGQFSRFGFLSSRKPIFYRALMLGILMDVEWLSN